MLGSGVLPSDGYAGTGAPDGSGAQWLRLLSAVLDDDPDEAAVTDALLDTRRPRRRPAAAGGRARRPARAPELPGHPPRLRHRLGGLHRLDRPARPDGAARRAPHSRAVGHRSAGPAAPRDAAAPVFRDGRGAPHLAAPTMRTWGHQSSGPAADLLQTSHPLCAASLSSRAWSRRPFTLLSTCSSPSACTGLPAPRSRLPRTARSSHSSLDALAPTDEAAPTAERPRRQGTATGHHAFTGLLTGVAGRLRRCLRDS